jgi:hypothetical protein
MVFDKPCRKTVAITNPVRYILLNSVSNATYRVYYSQRKPRYAGASLDTVDLSSPSTVLSTPMNLNIDCECVESSQ